MSWLEEDRKTFEVDGELTCVGIIFPLVAKLSTLPASYNTVTTSLVSRWAIDVSLYINSATNFLNIARGSQHNWGRTIYSPQ